MNDKPKFSSKEEIFDVFRPGGDHDISAENYRLKKQLPSRTSQGPIEKNHFTDARSSADGVTVEPQTLNLSGAEEAGAADDQTRGSTTTSDKPDSRTAIRLETFRIDMEERLAAMQTAQQKAKDQLSNLEDQSQGQDKLPES